MSINFDCIWTRSPWVNEWLLLFIQVWYRTESYSLRIVRSFHRNMTKRRQERTTLRRLLLSSPIEVRVVFEVRESQVKCTMFRMLLLSKWKCYGRWVWEEEGDSRIKRIDQRDPSFRLSSFVPKTLSSFIFCMTFYTVSLFRESLFRWLPCMNVSCTSHTRKERMTKDSLNFSKNYTSNFQFWHWFRDMETQTRDTMQSLSDCFS